jgi:hypothetical protein
VGPVAVGGPDVHDCCVSPIGAGPGYPVEPAYGLKVTSTRDACPGKVRLTLAKPPPVQRETPRRPHCCFVPSPFAQVVPGGAVVAQGSPIVLAALLGLGILVSHPTRPPQSEGALGLAPVFSRKAGFVPSPGAFRTSGRNAHIWPARASCVPCPKFSPGVRCGVPLRLLSHSGRRFNVGPVARAVNPGGAPSAARKGKSRSSSGCRNSGAPSRPRAACSVPCRAGQSWWPLLTGDVEISPGQFQGSVWSPFAPPYRLARTAP